ncbi:MFS transporter [Paenibacillus baekrokdamisoli]|uniref:MFS transporter n=1 Tax=Paenibacillus baekrokdamisoli TaxID=1712516 RepID=A0A3G9J1I3_9BACL|nr:MFS transporter [Paenibacillus baekrokdamisoli]MBB3067106.1 MFS family permease [Paenibacillus baekrokdamisoli]BBH19701.1 MFS transporter [Paenibacillus baekrokdamisoli]
MQWDQKEEAKASKIYYGWVVVFIAFLSLLVSAGINSIPSVLMLSFEKEFGWDRAAVSGALSIKILLYGLMGPFSAALMARFGIRRMMVIAMILLAASLSLTPLMNQLWEFFLLWGVMVGLGTGMMANVLGVTVANRWFVKHKGLVVGLLTASAATGQLLFLPLLARVTEELGWRYAIYTTVAALLIMIPVVAVWMRNHPYDVKVAPLGSTEIVKPSPFLGNLFLAPILALGSAAKSGTFWMLAGTFFFCGFSTNGLIGTHLIPACGDYAIPIVMAAGLLAIMGMFDLVGTTLSGWLSDRFDSRWLLFWYYGLRGLSLLFLPQALGMGYQQLLIFAVFYGLDWIATVPPTVKITSDAFGKEKAGMVFGWIMVAHQLGASTAAYGAGVLRDWLGSYTVPFVVAGFVCLFAALMSVRIQRYSKGKIVTSIEA